MVGSEESPIIPVQLYLFLRSPCRMFLPAKKLCCFFHVSNPLTLHHRELYGKTAPTASGERIAHLISSLAGWLVIKMFISRQLSACTLPQLLETPRWMPSTNISIDDPVPCRTMSLNSTCRTSQQPPGRK